MDNFYTTILALGSFFGAMTIILTFLHKYNVFIKIRNWLLEPNTESIEEIKDHLNLLDDKILCLTIYSNDIPIEQRLRAGEIYTEERKLNGEIKAKYKVLKKEYENKLKGELKDEDNN